MSDIAVRVEHLSKQYRLGASQPVYPTFREAIMDTLKAPVRMVQGKARPKSETFWALDDVSFEIKQGEAVGIIGRNGAGKSTLLKILSRVTRPTRGRADLYGRVGSLLEVGTGFHPELTGRENIFLNGAILGMSRNEIQRKFDEIVDFSGVEKFLDTAVKFYSSGMYVRLAFAVAAHLEPEILIVDEVLAVGDAEFQKKCLGKMGSVTHEGRTVLFVSHNMAAVSALCKKALVLKSGHIQFDLGDVEEAISLYLTQVGEFTRIPLSERTDRQGEGNILIDGFETYDQNSNRVDKVISGQTVEFRISYHCPYTMSAHQNIAVAIGISSTNGGFVSLLSNQIASDEFPAIPSRGSVRCCIPKLPLSSGSYMLNLIIRQNDIIQDWIQEAIVLDVENGDFFGTGRLPPPSHSGVFFEQKWQVVDGV